MANRKSTKKYYFSVEGETEQWYLKWLQSLINTTEEAVYKVSFDCSVQKNPYKRAKTLTVLETGNKKVDIYHLSDYESDEPAHVQQFTETMDNMKKANEAGKNIRYEDNFKRCLRKLQLSNVIDAINRAKMIMQNNHENGCTLHQYKGYKYYKENPSLAIGEAIEKILRDVSCYN